MNPAPGSKVTEETPTKQSSQTEFTCCFNSICSSKGQCCLGTLRPHDDSDDNRTDCVLNTITLQNEETKKVSRCFGSLCDQCETSNKCLFTEALTIPTKNDIEFVGIKIETPSSPECCMLVKDNNNKCSNVQFDCTKCMYKTDVKRNLQRHLLTHADTKLFKCSKCDYSATQRHHLQQHMITHCTKQILDCANCQYKCNLDTQQTYKPYICVECDYRAATKHHLQQHVASHATEKLFKCTTCDYTTTRRYNLQQHALVHDPEKPFRCSECDYSTTRKYHLQNHMSIHTGDRPFQCTECDYSTPLKRSLLLHMLTHNNNKQPLECNRCHYKCSTKALLTKHLKLRCGDVSFNFDY